MGVMTPNASERTVISSYRFVAAFVGQFFAQYAVGMLVVKFGGGDDAKGYQLTLGLLSTIAVILLFITFATTKERVHPPKGQKSPIRQDMRDLFTNGPWLMIGIATFFQLSFISLRSGIIPYYFDYYVNSGEVSLLGITRDWSSETLLTTYLMSGTAIMVLGAVLTKKLTRIIGKAICYWGFLGLSAAATALYYFLDPDDLNLMFILNFVRSFAMGPVSVLQWAMYTDCADYSEWKTGRRATALIMSASLFSLKMGLAVGSAALTWILAIYGYEANVEQSEESIKGIVLLMSIYPAIIALFGMVVMVLYPLNNKKMAQIEADLIERRKQAENDSADA
jgi:GPH family glycoside/pentoside/hexuronide:cation symporter